MGLSQIFKIEVFKLSRKKTTLLLLCFNIMPVFYAIGMKLGILYVVNDGQNDISIMSTTDTSLFDFFSNMWSMSLYIIYFCVIVIASVSLANEREHGHFGIESIRICSRFKMIIIKFFALAFYIIIATLIFLVVCTLSYYILVRGTTYYNGLILGNNYIKVAGYFMLSLLAIFFMNALTMLLGTYLKTFSCFAISYLVWIILKYVAFWDIIKLFIPDSMAEETLKYGIRLSDASRYMVVIFLYYIFLIGISSFRINKLDLK